MSTHTICAVSTASGGAIGVVRVSGSQAISITEHIFRAVNGKPLSERKASSLTFGHIVDENDKVVDEVLVSLFRAPHSYTGEDATEISCHGSSYILQRVVQLLLAAGCEAAAPGEFTQRAFLNGKMDLSQAEAVADVIASTTAASHQVAMSQMRGDFSKQLGALREQLVHLTSLLELELDFSDHEDLEFADRSALDAIAEQIESVTQRLADSFATGNVLKNGLPVAIVGSTNSGKSTLLNLLSKSEVFAENKLFATLDTTVRKVIVHNLPFLLADTVGFIRKLPTDLVDSFKSTLDETREADLLVHVVDVSHPDFEEQLQVVNRTLCDLGCADKPQILVFNKMDAYTCTPKDPNDLTPATKENVTLPELMQTWMGRTQGTGENMTEQQGTAPLDVIFISARERENIEELRDLFYKRVREIHVQKYPYNDFLFYDYDAEGEMV